MSKSIRWRLTACLAFGVLVWSAATKNAPAASGAPDLSGTWRLNRGQSEFPSEVAFGPQWQDTNPSGSDGRSSGGGRRGGRQGRSGGGAVGTIPDRTARPESEEDAQKIDQLMDEVKNPPATLTILQTEGSVTISDAQGVSRTFRTNGKEQVQQLKAGPMVTISAAVRQARGRLSHRAGSSPPIHLRKVGGSAASAGRCAVARKGQRRTDQASL